MTTVPLGQFKITDRQKQYVNEVLDSSRTSYGPFTEKLEKLLAEVHQVKHCIFMASGTCALHLELLAAKEIYGWPDGAKVIVPATTFIATVAAVRHAGLTPVLCDVDFETGNMQAENLGSVVDETVVGVIVVHLLGRAADIRRITEYCRDRDIAVFEDCCEAIGVSHNGKAVGSFGLAGAVSSYVCHHISTGIGGAILTNDNTMADVCRSLMVHGRDTAYLKLEDDDGLEDAALAGMMQRRYSFVRWGHSFRATEMEAALGVAELEDRHAFDNMCDARTEVARWIQDAIGDRPGKISTPDWPVGSVPLFYPVVCDNERICRELSEAYERAGIETRPVMPLLTQPTIRRMLREQGRRPSDFPNAWRLTDTAFLIGCHPEFGREQLNLIRDTTESYFNRHLMPTSFAGAAES